MNHWLDVLPAFLPVGWRELLDIFLVAVVFHRVMLLVRGTRAVSVIHGVIVVLLAYYLSGEFGLFTLHWLLANFLGSFFLVMVILFQADIRKALSQVGLRWFGGARPRRGGLEAEVELLADALLELARRRVGALVVLERGVPLGDVAARGVELSTRLTRDVLLAVFHHESPLHDGAVVARGGDVAAVGCILPLAASRTLPSQFGTRHRAAAGVTEDTDALALVVSEERGEVRAAQGGAVSEPLDREALVSLLEREWAGRA
ncbi:Cyclic di-AMP synthase CdaA [Fundidesulfovibrio magnetotacticus]|uniref:Diadenylate cyclase n=1 Tax=Fundidesulfovibrio magnetotacticus TaxID=2730080 RepID=A0A6V8M3Z1_9BACT|nr:diadenylate cyclase [Fundidesulfovibrio magnetotacticus]GFK95115.1 Cyclic di-AMP synthase CdaA [Fundidesulfovibrio magnetotacticus]